MAPVSVTTANTDENLIFDGTTTIKAPAGRDIVIQKTNIRLSNGVVHVIGNVIAFN